MGVWWCFLCGEQYSVSENWIHTIRDDYDKLICEHCYDTDYNELKLKLEEKILVEL